MMLVQQRMLTLCVLLLAGGCASPRPAQEPTLFGPTAAKSLDSASRSFAVPIAQLWDATIEVVTANEYPIATIERDSYILTTDWVVVESTAPMGLESRSSAQSLSKLAVLPETRQLFGEMGLWSRCRYKVSITLHEMGPDSSKATLTPHIECWETQSRKDWTPCPSTGLIERQFFDVLESELRGG